MSQQLTQQDYEKAAKDLDCEVAAVKVVAIVESSGNGFLSNGEVKILFEAHHFSRLTRGAYDLTNPKISSHLWNRKLYSNGMGEHRRLKEAVALDRNAALQSASWGAFQIMGFHWESLGYESLQAFINAQYTAAGQLDCFVRFIKHNNLARFLKTKDWKGFARSYNGPGYKENKYDTRMAEVYKKLLN